MNKTECQNERLSTKTVGMLVIVASVLLLTIGLLLLPIVGFFFAIPLLILGIGLVAVPESKTCRLVMSGIRRK